MDNLGPVGKGINAVGGPIVGAAGKVAEGLPVIGDVVKAGEQLGNAIPDPFGSKGPAGLPTVSAVNGAAQGGGIGSLLNSIGTAAPAILEGANATALQNKSNQYAQNAIGTQTGLWNQQEPLRAAGIAGLLNPATPAPGLPEIASLRQSAAAGNPFAPKPSSFAQPNGAPPVAPTSAPALPTAGPIGSPTGAPAMPTPPIIRPPAPPLGSLPSAGPVAGGGGAQAPSNLVY